MIILLHNSLTFSKKKKIQQILVFAMNTSVTDCYKIQSSYDICDEVERAKSSNGMSSSKILRINRLIEKKNQRLSASQDTQGPSKYQNSLRSKQPLVS